MTELTPGDDVGLWQLIGGEPCSDNRRPLSTHDRHLNTEQARILHAEHAPHAFCHTCGCCWCCDDDCCSEYRCPNEECGCNLKPRSTLGASRAALLADGGEPQ